jgi:HlyD family secretion protein
MTKNIIFKINVLALIILTIVNAALNNPRKEDITITLTGELSSKNPVFIDAPEAWNLSYQIVHMPPEGQWVEKGDTVVVFDTKEIEQNLEERLQNFEQLEKQLEQTRLNNEQAMTQIENQLKTMDIQKKITLNRLEQSKYNSEADQINAELELKKVNLNIIKTQQALESQKILNRNSENELLLQKEQSETRIKNYREMIDNMYMTAPKSGIIVYHKGGRRHGTGTKVKIGDTVRPSGRILQIPDLNNMVVYVELNEVDITKVSIGQPAEIEVLAYPDTVFTGKVDFISKIADKNDNSQLRIYPISIIIDGDMDERLKPGLTAKINLKIDKFEEGFSIPSWCLFKNNNEFYVLNNDKKIHVEVVKIYDGKAYVKGNLTTDMMLADTKELQNY